MIRTNNYFGLFVIAAIVQGCASDTRNFANSPQPALALIPGHTHFAVSNSEGCDLSLPADPRLSSGKALMFSPIDFRSEKDRFSIDSMSMPLGRYVAVRHSDEGIVHDLPQGQAKTFNISYTARYPSEKEARQDFPALAADKYVPVTKRDKTFIDIEQWHMQLSMVFSSDRSAFRVLLDQVEYIAPMNKEANAENAQPTSQDLPILVAFSYRHPDANSESVIQQNVIYEFNVKTNNGAYTGVSQISGWIPLHKNAQSVPYTVGVVVAEISQKNEEFYKQLLNAVKKVREFI
jgi:hypothetical protein